MKISEKFLKYFGGSNKELDILEETEELDEISLIEMEIRAVVEELAVEHPDTEKYTTSVKNLETLTKALENTSKAKKEQTDDRLSKTKGMDYEYIVPRVAGILVYGLIMSMHIAMEREHPAAMRLVQIANTVLSPKI